MFSYAFPRTPSSLTTEVQYLELKPVLFRLFIFLKIILNNTYFVLRLNCIVTRVSKLIFIFS